MRQKIIANKKAHEHKVVYDSLEVELKRNFHIFELKVEILSEHVQLNELELHRSRQLGRLLVLVGAAVCYLMACLTALCAFHLMSHQDSLS